MILCINNTYLFYSNMSTFIWSAAKIKLFLFDEIHFHEKFNGTRAEPTLNAVVSHGNFPETLMRECSPEIEETFLHFVTFF